MSSFKFTPAQRGILKAIADGEIINKYGSGYARRTATGQYIGKASIAVKSLGKLWLVAKAGEKIYFTTRGYSLWFGGMPAGERAELCKLADERVAYVKSMMENPE